MNIASAGHQAGTVRSHLDRIRDKTGCRRRADLTRLVPIAGLVEPGWPPGPARGVCG
jgi:hypothetical protein